MAQKLNSGLESVENTGVKGGNAFPPFLTMFSKGMFFYDVKSPDCVVKG